MLIKYQALAPHLQKNTKAVYVLVGLDPYLINEAAISVKNAWRQRGETDEKIIHINAPTDWGQLLEEANSYSLFAEYVLLDIRFDKKAIDAAGKVVLNQYLQNTNSRCLIILQASAVPPKQLQWLTNNEHVVLVQIVPLNDFELQKWIAMQLTQRSVRHAPQVPGLILQYSQSNMLACAQVIEKLALVFNEENELTIEEVQEQLVDQCDFQLYELGDACLNAHAEKALRLLRQANNDRVEPTLILWLLAQEIRQLSQLAHLLKQNMSLSTACTQLKIWPKRASAYQRTLARLSTTKLYQLLHDSKQLDDRIKTNQTQQIWQGFERLSLALCSA
jgi:DNA polymerase-3 subunit delta